MRRHVPRAGVTLTELLIVCLIMGLLTAGLGRLMVSMYESQAAVQGQNQLQKEAQLAADVVMDDLRGCEKLTTSLPTEVAAVFRNGDTVRYYLEGDQLKSDSTRNGYTVNGGVVCPHVSALTYTYQYRIGTTWESTTNPDIAQAVIMNVTVTSENNHVTQTTAVKFRNKKEDAP